MCTTAEYRSDSGRAVRQTTLCPKSRHGKPCTENPPVFQYPDGYPFAKSAPAASAYLGPQLPPSPSYTPRSGTPNYRSGDESDRSGSSSRSRRRSSGIYVSVNGQKVVDMNHSERRRSRDRVLVVDSPPTPPQTYPAPRTAPPSPSMPYIVDAPAHHAASSRRPVIVDERPRVTIELLDPSPSRRHARQSSTSSHESRHSRHSSYSDEEERQRRRERREEERRRAEKELKKQERLARIAKANMEINSRPVAPTPPPPPRHSAAFARPAVEVRSTEAELAEAVRRMRIQEDEAQRKRLLERMQPRRHATVGHASRRTRVLYDDGTYRWE